MSFCHPPPLVQQKVISKTSFSGLTHHSLFLTIFVSMAKILHIKILDIIQNVCSLNDDYIKYLITNENKLNRTLKITVHLKLPKKSKSKYINIKVHEKQI